MNYRPCESGIGIKLNVGDKLKHIGSFNMLFLVNGSAKRLIFAYFMLAR